VHILTIDTGSPTPVYEQIMEHIRTCVRDGELRPAAPLPSVRQLAGDLGVNPNTVAKAYMLLEREGILRSVRRRGCFVTPAAPDRVRENAGAKLEEALDHMVEQADRLGLPRADVLQALIQRLEQARKKPNPRGGAPS